MTSIINDKSFTPKHLKGSLGDFWTQFFSDQTLLDGWAKGLSLQSRQLDNNTRELEQLTGVETTPVHHIEVWRPLRIAQDLQTGGFYPLRFEDNAAKFGTAGSKPLHDKEFQFGGYTDYLGLDLIEDSELKDVLFITDAIDNPKTVLSAGINFEVKDGLIVFLNDIIEDGLFDDNKEEDLYNNQNVYTIWAYHCSYDVRYMAEQWGYLLGFEQESSTEYNRALWELWKARRFGLTPNVFKEIISIYTGCPRYKEDEVIEKVVTSPGRNTLVITDKNVYSLGEQDSPILQEGDLGKQGDFVGSRVEVLETGKIGFTRPGISVLPEFIDNKLLGDSGYIETNYIRFASNEAPSTIVKQDGVDYTPSYATLSLSSGEFDVTIQQLYRYSQYEFTMKIDPTMIPVPGTQKGTLQIFSVTGVPLFSEPFTASIDPIKGTATFYTDEDDVVREREDALQDIVDTVHRVVLVSMFEDSENVSIKSILESLKFSNKDRISVTIYSSISVYTDLPTEGASFSTVTQEHLLDYDMLLLNTGSGIISTLSNGETQGGPSITDNEFIQTVVSNLDEQILAKRKQIAEIDNDLVWILNYVHKGDQPFSSDWLYKIVGTRGIPKYNTTDGALFYSYGSFSVLDQEKIAYHEENNKKLKAVYSIPDVPWPSATGLGVITREVSVPVYSKRIDISGTAPQLETTLPSGVEYVYKVSSLEKQ